MNVTHKMGVFVCVLCLCLCLCLCLWVYLCLNVGDSKAECQLGRETELLCNQGAARTNRGRQSQRPIDVPTKGLTWPQWIQHQYIKRKMNFHNLWLYHIEIFEGTKKHEDVDILLGSDQIWVLGFSLIGCLSQLKLIKVEKTCRVYTSLKSTLQNTNRPWRVTWMFLCLLKTIWNASRSSFSIQCKF